MSEEGELDSTLFLGDDFIVLSETGEMTVIGKSLNDTSKRKSILDLDTRTPKRQRLETVLEESEDEDETLESRFDGLLSDDEDTIVPKTRDIGLSPIVVAASSSTSFKGSLITSTPIKKCDGCSKVPHFLDKITDYFKQITENQKQTQPEENKVENDKKVETEKVIEIPDEEDENINNKSVYHTSQQFISENIQCEFKTFKRGLRPIVIDGSNIALG
ncbi:PREDICTED: uncharacterized protein LOC108563037 [Nicrophorus vespilloides]|uniref:Uncharacterized protein LOC108563037 n=1 Tax=Nicrophorus vespilloides TaxID=110193 RepID=A0ABM1MR70_NICVS|nr:PREDICTED: uncharacterized protein LOC108563037 [Nicrophorus vespilloides]